MLSRFVHKLQSRQWASLQRKTAHLDVGTQEALHTYLQEQLTTGSCDDGEGHDGSGGSDNNNNNTDRDGNGNNGSCILSEEEQAQQDYELLERDLDDAYLKLERLEGRRDLLQARLDKYRSKLEEMGRSATITDEQRAKVELLLRGPALLEVERVHKTVEDELCELRTKVASMHDRQVQLKIKTQECQVVLQELQHHHREQQLQQREQHRHQQQQLNPPREPSGEEGRQHGTDSDVELVHLMTSLTYNDVEGGSIDDEEGGGGGGCGVSPMQDDDDDDDEEGGGGGGVSPIHNDDDDGDDDNGDGDGDGNNDGETAAAVPVHQQEGRRRGANDQRRTTLLTISTATTSAIMVFMTIMALAMAGNSNSMGPSIAAAATSVDGRYSSSSSEYLRQRRALKTADRGYYHSSVTSSEDLGLLARDQQEHDDIQQAMQIFRSLNIKGVCHPTSDAYAPLLPPCEDFVIIADSPPPLGRERHLTGMDGVPEPGPDNDDDDDDITYIAINVVGSVVCVIFVALISSMFLGYLTLEPLDLRIKMRASVDPDERRYARKLLPVVKQYHRLLVTLLLMNAIFYESLPLFLDNLVPSWAAILISVTVILVFGEIIPSAIITGPYQLQLASQLTPLLNFFLWALYPIAKPLTLLLDYLVPSGSDSDDDNSDGGVVGYTRGELSALVRIQYEDRQQQKSKDNGLSGSNHSQQRRSTMTPVYLNTAKDQYKQRKISNRRSSQKWKDLKKDILDVVEKGVAGKGPSTIPAAAEAKEEEETEAKVAPPPPLHHSEVKMVEGALTMKTKCVLDVYTPLQKLFSIPSNLELDRAAIASIYGTGFSRVPVYNPDGGETAIEGILITRQLILIDWDHERPVSSLPLLTYKNLSVVDPKMNLVDLLQVLQQGTIMALVCSQPVVAMSALRAEQPLPPKAGFMGVVTLEDVMEALLQESIYDEGDMAAEHMAGARLTQWWQQLQLQDEAGGENLNPDPNPQPSGKETTPHGQPDEQTRLLVEMK